MPTRGALTLFHVRGIRIGVDRSWFLVLFLVILWLSGFYDEVLGASAGEGEPYLLALASAAAFFGSIVLHELGHALVAMRNGIGITDITLWLFGGVARMSRDTDSAGVEFRVAAAGPAVTLLIALACSGIGVAIAGSEQGFLDAMVIRDDADVSGPLALLAWLAGINTLILVFNLIPAFPLDGGRIARAVAWRLTGDRNRATRFAAGLGQGFAYLFIALGLVIAVNGAIFAGIWLAVIGFVLGSSARGAAAQTAFHSKLEGIRVADVMDDEPVAIPQDASVERALDEYFLRYGWPWFPVADPSGRFRGMVAREALDAVPEADRGGKRVSEVMEEDRKGALQVEAEASLEVVLANDALRRLGALAVVDTDGSLRGVITVQRVARAFRDAVA